MQSFLVSASDAGVGVTSLWIISSSCSSEYIDMKALIGLLLLVFGHGVSSEFVGVAMVDGVQIGHYDSNTQRIVLKQDWMERYTRDYPDILEAETGNLQGYQQTFKAYIGILKEIFNQRGEFVSPGLWEDDTLHENRVMPGAGCSEERTASELHEQVDPGASSPPRRGPFQLSGSAEPGPKAVPTGSDWGTGSAVLTNGAATSRSSTVDVVSLQLLEELTMLRHTQEQLLQVVKENEC
ncbi:unnamed protein product [Boreogadus saida]